MNRLALLIQAPLSGKDHLNGVRKDIICWEKHLMSLYGGAWKSSEIEVMLHPQKKELMNKINSMGSLDYGIVAFSGHGLVRKDSWGFSETFMYINDDESISERQLTPRCKRSVVSLDCCRKEEKIEEFYLIESASRLLTFSDERMAALYRQIFDNLVMDTERGCTRLYAASLNESAADDPSFTQVLFKCVNRLVKISKHITYQDAMDCVSSYFEKYNSEQKPVYNPGRRLYHLPLAIKI